MATGSTRQAGGRPRKNTPCPWGRKVEALAARKGLSRRELAERAEITYEGLWALLMGKARPRLDTACKLAAALGVPVQKLAG
jgi:transcriptional regulator with XRE-family HTH domain